MEQHLDPADRMRLAPVTVLAVCLVLTAGWLTACPSSASASSSVKTLEKATSKIPSSAFRDHTGVTPSSVTVGNVSTELGGLFTGAVIGTKAYAAYVNSLGGVNGRKVVVSSADDQFTGALNKQETTAVLHNDFASVGGFSLEDSFGESVVAENPGFPDITASLDPARQTLPNNFSPWPASNGWATGPLLYFKQRYPNKVAHTGTIVANLPSTEQAWGDERAAMEHLGYSVVYDPAVPVTSTDFTSQVVAMRNAGVQILFLEQAPQNYASAVIHDLDQQNFHPVVVLGAPSYSPQLVKNAGGAQAVNHAYLAQTASLYLGGDAARIPAVATFNTWVHRVDPGFTPDTFTLGGWLCAELFVDALRSAGADPSRGSLLQALRKIGALNSDNLIPVSNPAGKVPITCYLLGQITNGSFQRLDDPPVTGSTKGFRCDGTYFRST